MILGKPTGVIPFRDMLSTMSNLAETPTKPPAVPTCADFGLLHDGTKASLFTITCGPVTASFTDYGARLVSLVAPDRDGNLAHVVLGYDHVSQYVEDRAFMGAVVGRYGNRIARGRFTLSGREFQVPANNGVNALHGGPLGFDRKLWQAQPLPGGVEMTLISPDGDQGFPGTLTVSIRYLLSETPEGIALTLDYTATTDAETVVNVTNHAYFNLAGPQSGQPSESILDHILTLPAEHFTPTDAALIPTGEIAPVAGTPFDFRAPTPIGARIDVPNEQLQGAGGYDHNWVFGQNGALKPTARLLDPASGRTLTVQTTEPGMQFYSGNFLTGLMPSRSGGSHARRSGLCLETQHYPDSPNHPHFPSTVLEPGQTLRSTTIFSFGVEA